MRDAVELPRVPAPGSPMPRRKALMLAGALAMAAVGTVPWMAADRPLPIADARLFLQRSGNRLAAILNGPGDWPAKRAQVEALIDQAMDVGGIARFALGRAWKIASDAQRDEILRLFPRVLVGIVGRTFGTYEGFTFSVEHGTQIDNAVKISTVVWRWGDAPRAVFWLVAWVDGALKIIDIIAEGTSMRIALRNGYADVLQQSNGSLPALIETLQKAADTTS